jgi:DNA-binding NtrC family response regulator
MASASSESGLKGLVRNVKDEAEIEAISKALEQTNWNRKKAAAMLKISYKALLYKIRQYDIQRTTTV